MTFLKKTWQPGRTGGTEIRSVDLNRMEDGIEKAANARATRITRSGQWTFTDTGGFNTLTGWDIEVFDTAAGYDPAAQDRLTFSESGLWIVSLALNAEGGTGERFSRISLARGAANIEVDRAQQPAFANDIVTLKIVTPLVVNAGEYVYAQAGSYQKGSDCHFSVNLTAPSNYGEPHFAIWKVGEV